MFSEIREVLAVFNVISAVVAELLEFDGEMQHNKKFAGFLRHFLIPGTDLIPSNFKDINVVDE